MKKSRIFTSLLLTIGYLTKSEKYYYPPELKHTLNDLLTEKTSDRELSLTFRSKSKK